MRRWIVILLVCAAALSGGAVGAACLPPAVAAQSAERASQRGELTVCRHTPVDAATEYASNPAHVHFGAQGAVTSQRCQTGISVGGRWLRHGGGPAAADLGRRRAARGVAPMSAVLHPVDYYVYRLRRLLI